MKLYRVVAYVLNLNGDCSRAQDVIDLMGHNRSPEFTHIEEVRETDCGEWSDDHELNKIGCDYSQYFPELDPPGVSEVWLKGEYQRVRGIMVVQIDKNLRLSQENTKLREENESLKKIKEFVSTIKGLM